MAQSIRKADKPPIVFNPVPSECFAIGEKVHGSRYFEALVTVEQARRSPFLTFSSSSLKEPRKSCLMDLPSQGEVKRVSARLPGFERSGRYWGISERCHAIPSRRCGEFRGRNAHFWILSGFWMKSGTFFPHHWRCAVTEYISRFWIWVGVLSEDAPSLNGKSGW